ncbi:MAG: threonine--tRNA ligase, partial [Clostridia bacterium]|nr:threonine--tRNA ligase [Clostridia bacterium]
MFKVSFPEKTVEFEAPLSVFDAARAAELVSRAHVAAEVDGAVVGMTHTLNADCAVKLLTTADEKGKHVFNHTAAHILAQAVKRLYPAAKLTIGPAIESGFYYDFDSEMPFTAEVLAALEAEMKKIVKENLLIERFELPREEAKALMKEKDEPYKVQLIDELPEDAVISFYRQGEFVDL